MEEKSIEINEELINETDKPEVNNQNTEVERLFTQDEVNEIIRKRLFDRKKEQEKNRRTEEDYQKRENELVDREKAVASRETRLSCMEYLKENNYPDELLDVLDTSDIEGFKENVEKISIAFNKSVRRMNPYPEYNPEPALSDNKTSFPNSKHIPKNSEVRNW